MKKISLLIIFQIVVATLFAQKFESAILRWPALINPMKDKQEYQGYTIKILHAMPAQQSMISYGFDILENNEVVVHQIENPLLFCEKGIQKKEDAYKIAQWMIKEYKSRGSWLDIYYLIRTAVPFCIIFGSFANW